jgi:hypothetical protein
VRQMVFGQRYFESRFGKRCEVAWLPDSFGLTGAYPQLIRGAGKCFCSEEGGTLKLICVYRYEVLFHAEAVMVS